MRPVTIGCAVDAGKQDDSLMIDVVEPLILDLLHWLAASDRTYAEVMDVWRTSCPRLPVWEDANDRGLVARQHLARRVVVRPTPAGRALLQQRNDMQRSGAGPA